MQCYYRKGGIYVGKNQLNKIKDNPDKEIQVFDITRLIIQKLFDAYFKFKVSDSNSW